MSDDLRFILNKIRESNYFAVEPKENEIFAEKSMINTHKYPPCRMF